uniref:Uncharacterized protein n=1 Tax=viral metagenome TaxID=1070528 RepID=A0A6C0CAB7_9ZZZZ
MDVCYDKKLNGYAISGQLKFLAATLHVILSINRIDMQISSRSEFLAVTLCNF